MFVLASLKLHVWLHGRFTEWLSNVFGKPEGIICDGCSSITLQVFRWFGASLPTFLLQYYNETKKFIIKQQQSVKDERTVKIIIKEKSITILKTMKCLDLWAKTPRKWAFTSLQNQLQRFFLCSNKNILNPNYKVLARKLLHFLLFYFILQNILNVFLHNSTFAGFFYYYVTQKRISSKKTGNAMKKITILCLMIIYCVK